MRNILILALRYHAFLLFAFLEIISLFFVFNYNSYQRAGFLSFSERTAGFAYERFDAISDYVNLGVVNDSLAAENARLKKELVLLHGENSNDITRLTQKSIENYRIVSAKVISNSWMRRNNAITLNKGLIDNVKSDIGVVNDMGIVGVIKRVSAHYSVGISVLHSDFSVRARIAELDQVGTCVWDGKDYRHLTLNHIPRHVPVKVGQHVVVSQFSYLFPEGTPIGVIDGIDEADGSFYNLSVLIDNDLRNVRYVYAVVGVNMDEKVELENEIQE